MAGVDSEPHLTTLAHGRAMLGAGGTALGRAVRASAVVGYDTHTPRVRLHERKGGGHEGAGGR